jgi:hypothetical protein
MNKNWIMIALFSFGALTSQAQFGKLLDKGKEMISGASSTGDVAGGLKEALEVGVDNAVQSLSTTNGYLESPYKILIPEEAQKVTSKVSKLPGFQNIEADLIAKMNEAAEIAAKKATPIFVNAIKQMSFSDATNILMGNDDAATRYLEKTSRAELYSEFMPVIQTALDEVNAREYWQSAVGAYNKNPFTSKLNPELDDHVNNKALDGMFELIQNKEEGIREDKSLRTSPLLKEVFAQQDKS